MNDEFMYCPRCGAMAHIPKEELDEERLARALMEVAPDIEVTGQGRAFIRPSAAKPLAAAIAKAYREDTDATD